MCANHRKSYGFTLTDTRLLVLGHVPCAQQYTYVSTGLYGEGVSGMSRMTVKFQLLNNL